MPDMKRDVPTKTRDNDNDPATKPSICLFGRVGGWTIVGDTRAGCNPRKIMATLSVLNPVHR